MTKSLLLLSGGLESTALLYLLRPAAAVVVDYGQLPAAGELAAARAVATVSGITLHVVHTSLGDLGSGLLAGTPASSLAPSTEWWPFRNQLLATIAGMVALREGLGEVAFGAVAGDGFHADGRQEFFHALSAVMALQEGAVRVTAPAIGLSTTELIRESRVPSEVLGWTHSCHRASFACGACPGCNKRAAALEDLGWQG